MKYSSIISIIFFVSAVFFLLAVGFILKFIYNWLGLSTESEAFLFVLIFFLLLIIISIYSEA